MNPQDITFLLVHDAWLGAWAWEEVVRALRERGWTALAPDLPGHGEAQLTEEELKDITLSHYVEAVIQAAPNDGRVVLVGHGTGGPVVQLAAEQLGDRVAAIIFVQGYILKDGETIAGQMPPEFAAFFESMAGSRPDRRIDLTQIADFWRYNLLNDMPVRADELLARLVPEPAGPLFEPVQLKTFFQKLPPCAYISFNEDMSLPSGDFHPRMPNKLGKYRHVNVNAGHEGILTKPREVAEIIMYLVTQGL